MTRSPPPFGHAAATAFVIARMAIVAALGLALLAAGAAHANDRPFQSARTAVSEEDDEGSWSLESWLQRRGSVRGLSVEPEYTFTPYTSVQMELSRLLDRDGNETGHEIDKRDLAGIALGRKHAFSEERCAE